MKLLVFAHVPPPHHGQSFMVQQLVEGLADAAEGKIELFHVDARLSKSHDDIGGSGFGKVFKLVRYCLRAIWIRLRYGVKAFYYVPAPPKRAALYRDWIVMLMCRPFFKHIIFHWHAVGLGQWLEGEAEHLSPPKRWEKWLTQRLLGRVELSMVLGDYNRTDAEVLRPKSVTVVPNGIPDPCPDFAAAQAERASGANEKTLRVLYLGHCTRDKGLFDTLEAVKLANGRLAGEREIRLTVAGEFLEASERLEFDAAVDDSVEHVGFLGGEEKRRTLSANDCLCFPTFYLGESFGLVLLEAMAFGLTPVVSDWRTVGELARRAGIEPVPARDPDALAAALEKLARQPRDTAEAERLRQHFIEHYTIKNHLEGLAAAVAPV